MVEWDTTVAKLAVALFGVHHALKDIMVFSVSNVQKVLIRMICLM
jgi:hypothetical protein